LLLLGLTGGLGAQAAEPPLQPGPDPRPATPAGQADPANTAAAQLPATVAEAALCRALAEVAPAGAAAVFAGAAGLPAGAFSGFSDTLPTAAEPPPPAGSETLGPAAQAGPGIPGAGASAGATAATAKPQPAPAAATPPAPPPAPEPHPPLAFDTSLGVPRKPFGKLIYRIARNYALNPLLVAAMVQVESDFNPRARSRKGACGLMQVLPSTARRFGLPRRRDLFNPRKNLETASRYLRWLVDRFGDDPIRVLAAYNAGEGAVERFGGVPPFAETRGYVQRIFAQLGFSALLDAPAAGGGAGAAK
jgi:soluble lytic murein transglycosylase-like protein